MNHARIEKTGGRLRRGLVIIIMVLAVILIVVGLSISVLQLASPQTVERSYGALRNLVVETQAQVSSEPPTVRLGSEGGLALLDACDGSFSEMVSYREPGAIPVYAAHNNCGGDIIHPWQVGQEVRIQGREQLYEVVEVRNTPKQWGTTDDLKGLAGDLALQTCYYGFDEMKFVGLAPIRD